MKADRADEEVFYIGYLPRAPRASARFTRNVVAALAGLAAGGAALMALTLPYFGAGVFNFGHPEEVDGVWRCGIAPRLLADDAEYLLVGYGKNGVAPELCGATDGQAVQVRGTRITRDGTRLLEVTSHPNVQDPLPSASGPATSLGFVSLTGEIVDPKCYFGVMNPGEGRTHRACAVLCLRGGIPAVFVARDQTGARVPLLIADRDGRSLTDTLLSWVGEPVRANGELFRQGEWLVWRIDPATLTWAR